VKAGFRKAVQVDVPVIEGTSDASLTQAERGS
jgi:hypothetical protein